nr:MAG TPA: hypothetical protein [Caudoviricetes sp.]
MGVQGIKLSGMVFPCRIFFVSTYSLFERIFKQK